ncbi:MAG: GntR family transcriptional regulator [Pseudomonadota bacterium]
MHSDLAISQTDPRPMYLQIKEQIRHRIAVGDWSPGQEIPSIRTLAIGVRVSVITIKRAYLELEREGVIVTRQGKGSFVTEQVGIGQDLQGEELDGHLNAAALIASQLGLSSEELSARLRRAERHIKRKP